MSKTLATFMTLAVTAVIIGSLLIGMVYTSLDNKNDQHEDTLEAQYQLKRN